MFVLEQLINEIHTAFAILNGAPGAPVPIAPEIGANKKPLHGDTPRIVWTLTGGKQGAATKVGGPDANLADALCQFWVWLWFDDMETCWNAMSNMLAAIRSTTYGPNSEFVGFDCPTEESLGGNLEKGSVIVMTVILYLPLRVDGTVPATEVQLESFSTTVTEDDGVPDDEGNFDPFETQLVTGP